MKTIAIVDGVTENKVMAIKIYREAAKVGLNEAKIAIDGVEAGTPALFEVEDSAVYDVIQNFKSIGVEMMIADGSKMVEAKITSSDTVPADKNVTEKFNPIVPASEVAKIEDRDVLKAVLAQVASTIKIINDYSDQIETLQSSIKKEKERMEEVRKNPPFTAEEKKITTWTSVGVAAVGFFVVGVLGAAVLGIGTFCVSRVLLTNYIVKNNPGRCIDAAYKYDIENIRPLENELADSKASLNRLAESGQVAWAVGVVGEDMFDTESVNILYHIVDGRRADTMKEALNKYDEEMYRRNMQAMQFAAQQASEATAAEAVKQTNALKNIEQSSKKVARATQTSTMINVLDHSTVKQQKKLLKQWKKDGLL